MRKVSLVGIVAGKLTDDAPDCSKLRMDIPKKRREQPRMQGAVRRFV